MNIEGLMAYWNNLQSRERKVLIIGAICLLILFGYAVVWEPHQKAMNGLRAQIDAKQQDLAWMQQAANSINQLRAGSGGRKGNSKASLLTIVDSSAKQNQLGPAVKRVQPDGQQRVQVWLEKASFDDLMRWVDRLNRQHGVVANSLFIEKGAEPGQVDAKLVLERLGV